MYSQFHVPNLAIWDGLHLSDHLKLSIPPRNASLCAQTGTLTSSRKRKFVDVVRRELSNFTDLPKEVQAFVEHMHQVLAELTA